MFTQRCESIKNMVESYFITELILKEYGIVRLKKTDISLQLSQRLPNLTHLKILNCNALQPHWIINMQYNISKQIWFKTDEVAEGEGAQLDLFVLVLTSEIDAHSFMLTGLTNSGR